MKIRLPNAVRWFLILNFQLAHIILYFSSLTALGLIESTLPLLFLEKDRLPNVVSRVITRNICLKEI